MLAHGPAPTACCRRSGGEAWTTGVRQSRAQSSWWAMAVLLALDAAAFLSLVVAYLRLWLAGEGDWPPLDQALPALSSGPVAWCYG